MLILKQHPLSAAFPAMPAKERAELLADIRDNGLMLVCITLDNMILDGWHRYQCCLEAGVEPRTKPLAEELDPVAFVRSMNGTRRHLTASQRAMTEVALNEWAKRGGQPESLPGNDSKPVTAAKMAEAAHVSLSTIEQAKAVTAHAPAATVAAVRDGEISVKEAAKSLPPRPAATPASPKPDAAPELNAAFVRIAKVCGKAEAQAVIDGIIPLIDREVLLWAKLDDAKMREVGHLVIGSHWTPSRALRLLDRMVDEKTRIEEIISLCIAGGGSWQATINGHVVTVEKRGDYKR